MRAATAQFPRRYTRIDDEQQWQQEKIIMSCPRTTELAITVGQIIPSACSVVSCIDAGVSQSSGGHSYMQLETMVYVFTGGGSGVLGFSLQKSGSDLPQATSYQENWNRAYEVRMSEDALDVFRIDTIAALSDLRSCGFHVARPVEDVQTLPKHHRGSS